MLTMIIVVSVLLLVGLWLNYYVWQEAKPSSKAKLSVHNIVMSTAILGLGFLIGHYRGELNVLKDKKVHYTLEIGKEKLHTNLAGDVVYIKIDTTYHLTFEQRPVVVPTASVDSYILEGRKQWATATFEFKAN